MQEDGSLRVKSGTGTLTESPPVAWQDIRGNRVPVKGEFRVAGNEVGFVVGPYDRSQPLIIDPTLEWHTFHGSSGYDGANEIALDNSGNVYVTGESSATWGTPIHAYSGSIGSDLFVMKLDSSGAYQWHTFHGSSSYDYASGIAVDGMGNVYVSGTSDATWGSPLNAHTDGGIGNDVFVLKLDSNGAYQWHTFFGSCSPDHASGIAVDGMGNVYVSGTSDAPWGAPIHPYSGDADDGDDAFVLKLGSNGAYQWHAFYGSTQYDTSGDIAVDSSGNIYVTGSSWATWGSPLHAHSGNGDIFVLKLDGNGAYQWHTFYGSNQYDSGRGLAIDGSDNVYVTGSSYGPWGAPLNPHTGKPGIDKNNIVVLKLDSSGAYQWHTFLGSEGSIYPSAINVDSGGNVYVSGQSGETWGFPLYPHSGYVDALILKLDSSGAYQWHTFHGSAQDDSGRGLVIDGSDNIYVTGYSYGSWGSPLNAHSGEHDLFVLRLSKDAPETGFVSVTIIPQGAVDAGAQWRVDGGAWRNSNTTLSGLPEGSHAVEFKDIFGWYTPQTQVVNIVADQVATASGTYVQQRGSLSVTIIPQSAIDAGAQWRVDDGPWQNSGETVSGLSVGQHVLRFKDLVVWTKPVDQMATILENQITTMSGGYVLVPAVGLVDFNGDVMADILWRHTAGALCFWQMDGLNANRIAAIPAIDQAWRVAALGDFNGDGMTDILWRHTGGMVYIWLMNGPSPIGFGSPGGTDLSWSVVGAADFGSELRWYAGADNKADILWRHKDGKLALWVMDGLKIRAIDLPWDPDLSWRVEALADFNADRKADILMRNNSGMLLLLLRDVTYGSPGSVDLGWSVASAADFTGDGKADIFWRHTSGAMAIWQMDGLQLVNVGLLGAVDPSWYVADTSDYNRDSKADILWRHSSGATSLWLMNGFTRIGEGSLGFVDPSWKIENK